MTDHGRFFTQVQMAVTPDEGLGITTCRTLFEAANEQHLSIEIKQALGV